MQKWGKFTKKISSYFAGHPLANKQSAPRAVPKRGRGFSARLFLVNHFFSSQDAALTTQSLIYAKEGTAALKKAAAMAALLADTTQRAGTLYQQYKQARVNQSIEAVALLTTLIDAILQDHPALAVKAGTPVEQVDGIRARLRDAMQTHITNLATFELNPANLNKPFPSPYVSPDTTYATMAANYQVKTRFKHHRRTPALIKALAKTTALTTQQNTIAMPTFTNTFMYGARLLNPGYWMALALNGLSKVLFEYPARGICWATNQLFGKARQSTPATITKSILAGPFIALRAVSFGIAKLCSPGGTRDTLNALWQKITKKKIKKTEMSSARPIQRAPKPVQDVVVAMMVQPFNTPLHVSPITAPPPGNQSHAIKRPSSTASMYQSMQYSNDGLMLSEIKVNMEEKSQLTQASLSRPKDLSSLVYSDSESVSSRGLRAQKMLSPAPRSAQPASPSHEAAAPHRRIMSDNFFPEKKLASRTASSGSRRSAKVMPLGVKQRPDLRIVIESPRK